MSTETLTPEKPETPIQIQPRYKNNSWTITKQLVRLFGLIISPRKQIRYFQKPDSSYMLFIAMAVLVVWGHINFLPFLFKTIFPEWTAEMATSRAWGLSLFLEGLIFIFATKKIKVKFLFVDINTILKYAAFGISFSGFIFELVTKWETMNIWQFVISFGLLFITAVIPTLAMLGFAKDLLKLAKKRKTTKTNIPFKDNSELQDRIKTFVNSNPAVNTIAGVFANFKTEVGETNLRNFLKESFAERFGRKR